MTATRLALWPSDTSILAQGYAQTETPAGGVVYVGIDPGQHGAVGAVRVVAPGPGAAPRVVAAAVVHAAGAAGYQRALAGARRAQLDPLRARQALRLVVGAVGEAPHVLVALEALGLRPGEGVVSTSTAGVGHGVWRGVLGPLCADSVGWSWRQVQTQQVDRVMGLPAVGRKLRKGLVLSYGIEALAETTGATAAQWREVLTPMGARVVSDGAGDAVWMGLAMARGL